MKEWKTMNDAAKRKDLINAIVVSVGLILMMIVELVDIPFSNDVVVSNMVNSSVSRFIGGAIFVYIIYSLGYKFLSPIKKPFMKSLLIILPPLAVSIYNFPFIAYATGKAEIIYSTNVIIVFALECISTGFFEEIVFRGFLLVILLGRFERTKIGVFKAIVLTSVIFGLIHFVNLIYGADISSTLLQIGYSFLMGLMWSVVFIKTKNIWLPILLHSVYNFTGLIFVTIGTMYGRFDTITTITTTLLAIVVAVYMIYVLYGIKMSELKEFYE